MYRIIQKLTIPFANMFGKATTIKKEQLTKDALNHLLGVDYGEFVIKYNSELPPPIPPQYNDMTTWWLEFNQTSSKEELNELFNAKFPKFELVMPVVMPVAKFDYPGLARWTKPYKRIKFDKNGNHVVGNLIIRSKATGKLKLFKRTSWIGINYPDSLFAPYMTMLTKNDSYVNILNPQYMVFRVFLLNGYIR